MKRSKAIVASYVGVLAYAAVLFLAAGKLAYRQGLLYVALALVGTTLSHLLEPKGSNLAAERASRVREGEAWDRRILGASSLVSLVMFVVAGLDSGRFGWTQAFPGWATALGAILMLVGQLVFALARRENAFFSSTVRIQTGQTVCDTGPYRHLRHPGYLGMLLSLLAFPLVLSSWWAFVPACVGAALLFARTVLEDRFLKAKLPGYPEYAAKTKWRLIPPVF